jgi:hypothetical protein
MKTRMKRRTKLAGVLFTALLTMSVAPALADKDADQDTVTARLSGFQETPLTISSPGSAVFIATIRADETAIDYVLTYRDLSSPVTQSHIHFGRPAVPARVAAAELTERFLIGYSCPKMANGGCFSLSDSLSSC